MYEVHILSPHIPMASIVCAVRVKATLRLMRLVPCILYVNAAAPLLVAATRGTNEWLKGREMYRIILTMDTLVWLTMGLYG